MQRRVFALLTNYSVPRGRFMNVVFAITCTLARCGAALFALLACVDAGANEFFAANASGTLARFNTASPGSAPVTVAITGMGLGESIIAIDIRPLGQKLYALSRDGSNAGRLYTVDTTTGAATLVA